MSRTQALIGDMPRDGWIDRFAPTRARPYLKLMRLERPIGTWLLLFPCWWAVTLASRDGRLDPWLLVLFAAGALIMRGAGCVINDLWDRDIDGRVERTRARPIASGQVSPRAALVFLAGLLLAGLLVLVQFNAFTIVLGLSAMVLVVVYPLMKRVTYWPQVWLGLTFNWGALLGWTAVHGSLDWAALALYAAGILWTLGYDTIYGHQDKEDDVLVGVKSAAIALGPATRPFLFVVYSGMVALLALAGGFAGLGWAYYPALLLVFAHLMYQAWTVDFDDPLSCLAAFRSNRVTGWLVLAALLAGVFVG